MTTMLYAPISVHEIDGQVADHSLVIFSPRYRGKNQLLSWFVGQGDQTFYYSLTPQDTTLPILLRNFVETFQDTDPRFGKQTEQSLHQAANLNEIAEALLSDLSKIKSKTNRIILDNFDFLEFNTDTADFFQYLVEKLPKQLQLVLNGRTMTYEPWATLVRQGKAIALADERTMDGGIYDTAKQPALHLEVYALAGGNVYINGRPITAWDGPLPRNLFYYFIDHSMVTREDIFKTFWPELATKEATNVFHVTKRKISERLGCELTTYSGGFYRPSKQLVLHYDAHQFETLVEAGDKYEYPESVPDEYYQALRLYRTPFLHRNEMPWVVKRRAELKAAYIRALIGIGRILRSNGNNEDAIPYYTRALREIPEREDVHRDLMTIYAGSKNVDKVVAQYNMLSKTLKKTLNIAPSAKTQNLYKMLVGADPK